MTPARAALVSVLVFLAVLGAGCSGSSGPKKANPVYAGMPLSAARQAALVESGSETTDGSNEIYGHHLRLVSITKDHDPTGEPAWKATFKDLTQDGQLLCIWMANQQYSGGLTLRPCPNDRKAP
ncbi:MAG TPA: hypothetical protein VK287_02660 [Gaiellaceae bacterium]|nr:hypothetical protein [Gaiellaceae bacterium]